MRPLSNPAAAVASTRLTVRSTPTRAACYAKPVPSTGHHTGIAALHAILLLLVPPCTVVWLPVLHTHSLGTATALDLVLALLWITTLIRLDRVRKTSTLERRAVWIAVLAMVIAGFGALAAYLYDPDTNISHEVLQHTKRFGMPSVLPLALLVAQPIHVGRAWKVAIVVIFCMVAFSFTPLGEFLPITAHKANLGDRYTGTLSNPNDFAYIGLLGGVMALSYASRSRHAKAGSAMWIALGVSGAIVSLIGSGSRSAMAAALAACALIVMGSRIRLVLKSYALMGLVAVWVIGTHVSPMFEGRTSAFIEQRLSEPNARARIEAQRVVFRTWLAHPLGFGFGNMPRATADYSQDAQAFTVVHGSDSVYFDFLGATGLFGFACLIGCFYHCWRLLPRRSAYPDTQYLKAGLFAMWISGLATVAPASVFVAPFFFILAGLGGCLARDRALYPHSR